MLLNEAKPLKFPLEDKDSIKLLRAGDMVTISGWILCGRDATHRKILNHLGRDFSFDFSGELIYYVGPTPPLPGKVIGSCGPTTSSRLDPYLEPLLKLGLSATMGKGKRSPMVKELLKKYKAIYLATFGGAGAYLSQFVEKMELIAFPELGPEAFFRLKVKDFPAIVINDIYGNDFYEEVASMASLPA
jgi:fumarate hydratase subunit beta